MIPQTERVCSAIWVPAIFEILGYLHHNLEAIALGQVPDAQAHSTLDCSGGERLVVADASVADDIFHYRFAPRVRTVHDTHYVER